MQYNFGVRFLILLVITSVKVLGECDEGCDLQVYEQLKCTPKYEQTTDCCPTEYDCSNIFNRTEDTCHLRGKLYKPQEIVPDEEIAENCFTHCGCTEELEFKCLPPRQNCHEHYIWDFPKKDCYLQYKLDGCCASGQQCPPFDNITICEVNGRTYREGQRFIHPKKKCTKCVCSKDFDGTFEGPTCQTKNCTTEIEYSKEINKYCAPYYIGSTCCPVWWVCPKEGGEYVAVPKPETPGPQCRFGDTMMDIGSKYMFQDKFTAKLICKCVVPPLLSCFEQEGD